MSRTKPMTIGQLARQTAVPIKVLREYERRGFIYTLGRSESNYRLFDEEALWCVHVVQRLRSLGLTLKEIQEITTAYLKHPDGPVGPQLKHKVDRALARVEARLADLQALRQRILDFQTRLSAQTDFDPFGPDPRRAATREQGLPKE